MEIPIHAEIRTHHGQLRIGRCCEKASVVELESQRFIQFSRTNGVPSYFDTLDRCPLSPCRPSIVACGIAWRSNRYHSGPTADEEDARRSYLLDEGPKGLSWFYAHALHPSRLVELWEL